MEPLRAVRRGVDQLGEPRRDPLRERAWRFAEPSARYVARHGGVGRLPGRRMRLLEMVDLPTCLAAWANSNVMPLQCRHVRKSAPFDNRYLVWHVGMRRIAGDGVDAGFRHDLARLVSLRHRYSPRQTASRFAKRRSTRPRSSGRAKQKRPAAVDRFTAFINMGVAECHAGRSGVAPLV